MKKQIDPILIIVSVYALLITIFTVYVSYIYIDVNAGKIKPSECPKSYGDFGLQHGKIYKAPSGQVAVSQKCGVNKTSPCVSSAASFTEAVIYCNENIDICESFTYYPITNVVSILDDTADIDDIDPSTYMFTRQNDVIST